MVSDKIEGYLNRLVKKTLSGKIRWRPIKEYIDTCVYPKCTEIGIAQYIQTLCTEWFDLYYDKSFFVQKNGYTLALLNYKQTSGKDGSVSEHLELVGGIYSSPVKQFPEYIQGGFIKIQEAVFEYWKSKEGTYCLEISDIFENLSVFTEED